MELTDLILAILHHILVFTLVGLLAAKWALVRPGLSGDRLTLVGRIDAAYGATAALIVVVGVLRVVYGLKGWDYYAGNHAFWGKMLAFVLIGLLSIPPTRRIMRWRRAGGTPGDAEIASVRRWIKYEGHLLPLVLIFAAMMARGIGS